MRKLIIDENHIEDINKKLKDGQKRARVRIIYDYYKLKKIIDDCLAKLPELPKCALNGCMLTIKKGAHEFPACYNGIPYGTHVVIKFRKDGKGELIYVGRYSVDVKNEFLWDLTKSARDYIAKYYMKEINVGCYLLDE